MSRFLVLLSCLLALATPSIAQTLTWERLYKAVPNQQELEYLSEGSALVGNRILFAGPTMAFSSPSNSIDIRNHYYLLNSITGDTIWQRPGMLAFSGDTELLRQADGSFLYVGCQRPLSGPRIGYMGVQRITQTGQKGPVRQYPGLGPANAFPQGALPSPDKGYYLCIRVNRVAAPVTVKPIHVGHVDSLDRLQWSREYGMLNDIPYDMQQLADNSLVIYIHTYQYPPATPTRQIRLLRVHSVTGDSLQQVVLSAPAGNGNVSLATPLSKMLRLQDGGLLLPGATDTLLQPGVGGTLPYIQKVDSQLQPIWSYVYRGSTTKGFYFLRMLELQDGSVLALAAEDFPRPPAATYQLHHISASGRLLRLYPITTALCDAFQLATLIADPGGRAVYVAGGCQSPGNTGAYAARIDLSPSLPLLLAATPAQPAAAAPLSFELFPNPASTTATVRYRLPAFARHSLALCLYDLTGRVVRQLPLKNQARGEFDIDVRELPDGLYVCKLLADGQPVATQKLAVSQ